MRAPVLGIAVAAALAGAVLLAAGPDEARGSQYFVSPNGRDSASGASPARAWRTVARVNRAALRPGDEVLFRGGGAYSDAVLAPRLSGSSRAPIRYTSYGRGRADLRRGVYLRSVSWIVLTRLRVSRAGQGIAGAGSGGGARHIVIENSLVTDVEIGINSPNQADRDWRIVDNTVARTGDSGIIVEGADFLVADNLIDRTGMDGTVRFAKHGIYAKGPDISIVRNTITHFSTEGVSTRYRDARIVANHIRGGEGGIGYYRDDRLAGLTVITDNRITAVGYGIYIAPRGSAGDTTERFRILRNTAAVESGNLINAPFGGVSSAS